MHPGPINRGVELDSEMADSDQSVILEQVTNGVAVRLFYFFFREGVPNKVSPKNVRPFIDGAFQTPTTMNLVEGRWVDESIEGATEIDAKGALALPALLLGA